MAYGNNDNVAYGAPKVTGAVFIAPKGSKLPTNLADPLDKAFKNLGYMSDDGVVISEESDSNEIKAWGGATVQTVRTTFKETVVFTPIEINEEVAKTIYGAENVETNKESGFVTITTKHSGADLPEVVLVFETLPNATSQARYVAAHAKLTERGDITMNGSDHQGRELTFTLTPDENGHTLVSYEKMATK